MKFCIVKTQNTTNCDYIAIYFDEKNRKIKENYLTSISQIDKKNKDFLGIFKNRNEAKKNIMGSKEPTIKM